MQSVTILRKKFYICQTNFANCLNHQYKFCINSIIVEKIVHKERLYHSAILLHPDLKNL